MLSARSDTPEVTSTEEGGVICAKVYPQINHKNFDSRLSRDMVSHLAESRIKKQYAMI